jgi:hypothetical protein
MTDAVRHVLLALMAVEHISEPLVGAPHEVPSDWRTFSTCDDVERPVHEARPGRTEGGEDL